MDRDICVFTVLYVEDDTGTMETVGRTLYAKYPNCKLLFAENGADAVTKAKEHHPDVFIIDLQPPDMDGVELIRKILELNQESQILITSSSTDGCLMEKCLKMGVAQYMIKPLRVESLLTRLNEICEAIFWKRLKAAKALGSA